MPDRFITHPGTERWQQGDLQTNAAAEQQKTPLPARALRTHGFRVPQTHQKSFDQAQFALFQLPDLPQKIVSECRRKADLDSRINPSTGKFGSHSVTELYVKLLLFGAQIIIR